MKFEQSLLSIMLRPWSNWPARAYQRKGYQARLKVVQEHLAECLDRAAEGPVRVVSICAGDGRDVIGALQLHRRRNDVDAWLIELDRESVVSGKKRCTAAGLDDHVSFINGDATDYANYANLLPCDILLVCGVLGHVRPRERASMVRAVARFCKPGGSIIWTRGVKRGANQLTDVQSLFESCDCERRRVSFTPDQRWGIVTHRYYGAWHEPPTSGRVFQFVRKGGRQKVRSALKRGGWLGGWGGVLTPQ